MNEVNEWMGRQLTCSVRQALYLSICDWQSASLRIKELEEEGVSIHE
jgi:hypothetical protein